jgi:hypothetical protein
LASHAEPIHSEIHREAKNPSLPSPQEIQQAQELRFVFIGGLLNEAQSDYGEEWIATARSFGFQSPEFWSSPSVLSIEDNCQTLKARLVQLPAFVVVAHSKAAPELLCALAAEEKIPWHSGLSLQGAFFGSPLADFQDVLCQQFWSRKFFCDSNGALAGLLSLTREKVRGVLDPRLEDASSALRQKLKTRFLSLRSDARGRDLKAPFSMTVPLLSPLGPNDGVLLSAEQTDPAIHDLGVLGSAHNDWVSTQSGVHRDTRLAAQRVLIRRLLKSN